MGYTFIAVQGFDLIAAIAGDVKRPAKVIPRAMMLSLLTAMVIYLPLLLIVATVGVPPGDSIHRLSSVYPETVMALAAENFMGPIGFWLVAIAAVLSTLSALHANVLAASRVAFTMARDRALPHIFGGLHRTRGTPLAAVYGTAVAMVVLIVTVPNLSAAGAAASLIFLISFAMTHVMAFLARRRGGEANDGFRVPWFPLIPTLGVGTCSLLALFQSVVVPSAGGIVAGWLSFGVLLYLALFSRRAEVVDARAEASDPELAKLRGRKSLVLVPVANPETARPLLEVANALAPPEVGRVLLLSVLSKGERDATARVQRAQLAQSQAMVMALSDGNAPEALLTVASDPWDEIKRVAEGHVCESLLLGLSQVPEGVSGSRLEELVSAIDCEVSVLRAPPTWSLGKVCNIFVPVGGRGGYDAMRARLLGRLTGKGEPLRQVFYLRIYPPGTREEELEESRKVLRRFAREEAGASARAEVLISDKVSELILEHAARSDLTILGMQRIGRRGKIFGSLALRIAQGVEGATIVIGKK